MIFFISVRYTASTRRGSAFRYYTGSMKPVLPAPFKPIAFAIAAMLCVGALWHAFSPQPHDRQAQAGARPPEAVKDFFDLVIHDGKLAVGEPVMQIHQGEHVVLRIRSNAPDELHLHGYDLHARLTPQETAVIEFGADRTGRFTLELHDAQTVLGALEVYPR